VVRERRRRGRSAEDAEREDAENAGKLGRKGKDGPWPLDEAVDVLGEHYGPPKPLPIADPFELVLWENVAYLASPSKRREAFGELKRAIGTTPAAIRAATPQALRKITAKGILSEESAEKLRACAEIAVERFGGDLAAAVRGPLEEAKRALRRFPGIGEPGAEKILLMSGRAALLAPESNGLRVLVRLGLVREESSYVRTYAASREAAQALGADVRGTQRAHLLLQLHGQTLCKRSAPRCDECPLEPRCAYSRATAGESG
jgi:endonuclease III